MARMGTKSVSGEGSPARSLEARFLTRWTLKSLLQEIYEKSPGCSPEVTHAIRFIWREKETAPTIQRPRGPNMTDATSSVAGQIQSSIANSPRRGTRVWKEEESKWRSEGPNIGNK